MMVLNAVAGTVRARPLTCLKPRTGTMPGGAACSMDDAASPHLQCRTTYLDQGHFCRGPEPKSFAAAVVEIKYRYASYARPSPPVTPRRPAPGRPPAPPARGERREGMDWARRIELVTVVVAALVAVAGLWYSNVQTRQANEQAREDRVPAKKGQNHRPVHGGGRKPRRGQDGGTAGRYLRLAAGHAGLPSRPSHHRQRPRDLHPHPRRQAPAKGKDVSADVQAALTVLVTRNISRDGAFPPGLPRRQTPRHPPRLLHLR